jgi:hypothetical protein
MEVTMSLTLDAALVDTGTRFRIFPQPRFLGIFDQPEVITVSVSPADMRPGPADDRMFVIDAISKLPYRGAFAPPWTGPHLAPVEPGPDGHYTHLDPDSREFSVATMYATVRRALDIWEDYFGHPIIWQFISDFQRLEMIPLIEWDNAQSGYGFLEFGYGRAPNGTIDHSRPYCENFDVLAHELGHSIIFSKVGVPASPIDEGIDYGGMHESSGDLVAIIASMHFHSLIDLLLERTRGNLLTINGLDRVGELSDSRQIRIAFNNRRMSDVGDEPHDRSLPLTGAIFDTMVEMFQAALVARGLISPELRAASTNSPVGAGDLIAIQAAFDAVYTGHEAEFKTELLVARDQMGQLLAELWGHLSPNFLTYHDILVGLMKADQKLTGGMNQAIIRDCFAWREITPAPHSLLLRPHTLQSCGLIEAPMDLEVSPGRNLQAARANGHQPKVLA